jgi:Fe-S cluster biogenesis protein NfuA
MDAMKEFIEQNIRPSLVSHGGDIEFVELSSDGIVKVKLTGACSTCPGAQQTLAETVETRLKEVFPEVKGVVAVHQVSDELIQQALQMLRRSRK